MMERELYDELIASLQNAAWILRDKGCVEEADRMTDVQLKLIREYPKWEKELERIREDEYENGRVDGYAEGLFDGNPTDDD